MQDVYIVSAVRTAVGRFGGSLLPFRAAELGKTVIQEAVKQAQIDPTKIDEVILGNVYQAGGKGNPARQAAIQAGLPIEIPAMTINKQCASGLRAITLGFQQILAEEAEIIVAGGTESMSNVPHLLLDGRWGKKLGTPAVEDGLLYDALVCAMEGTHMGLTAENLAHQYQITRLEQDQFALNSQRKTQQAIHEGKFDKEIIPVKIRSKKGEQLFQTDEHPRETTLEKLQSLSPAFQTEGTVTAGNASGINDGASAVVLVSERILKKYQLTPLVRIRAVASAGVSPRIMGIGPVPATEKALAKAGCSLAEIDLIELNEAFAAQSLAVMKALDLDPERVNVNGGAIALGHAVGNSGSRIVVTLIHEMLRSQKSLGLATLCVGGGQGSSIIIEQV